MDRELLIDKILGFKHDYCELEEVMEIVDTEIQRLNNIISNLTNGQPLSVTRTGVGTYMVTDRGDAHK